MLKIKLSRTGKRGFATYNLVVAEARSKRDGRYIDLLGTYNPNSKPAAIKIDKKKLQTWIDKGAQPTETVRRLIKNYG
jgi:small subunit ribosomal protein S16